MSALSLLEQRASACGRLLGTLDTIKGNLGVFYTTLPLAEFPSAPSEILPSFEPFAAALRLNLDTRGLSSHLRETVCRLYDSRSVTWKSVILDQWKALYTRMTQLNSPAATLDLLQDAYSANYVYGLNVLHNDILKLVDERIQQFHVDSEAAASSDDYSGTDHDSARGHKAEAVAILEAAYAYTTNITQAEKRRLSQATGLEPRQVVIWFQNRRNRKAKGRNGTVAFDANIRSTTQSPPLVHKRKTSCNDDDQPRRPTSQVAVDKRTRLSAVPPPPLAQHRFANSSGSSRSSSSDSHPDSIFENWSAQCRAGKERNVSSGSSATSFTSHCDINSQRSAQAEGEISQLRQGPPRSSPSANCESRSTSTTSAVEVQGSAEQPVSTFSAAHASHRHLPDGLAHIFDDERLSSSLSGSGQPLQGTYLFTENSNTPELDFDDLGMDNFDFEKQLVLPWHPVASAGPAQVWRPNATDGLTGRRPPLPWAGSVNREGDYIAVPAASPKMEVSKPSSLQHYQVTDVAEALNDDDFDLFQALAALPTIEGMSADSLLQFASNNVKSTSLRGMGHGHGVTPSSMSVPYITAGVAMNVQPSTPPSQATEAASAEDFSFTFDMSKLGLDRAFEDVRQSYRLAEEEATMYDISDAQCETLAGETHVAGTEPEALSQLERLMISSSQRFGSPTRSTSSSSTWSSAAMPSVWRQTRTTGGMAF